MTANIWAVALFVGILVSLMGAGVIITNPAVPTVLFLVFAPAWLLAGYVWDWLTLRVRDY